MVRAQPTFDVSKDPYGKMYVRKFVDNGGMSGWIRASEAEAQDYLLARIMRLEDTRGLDA